MNLSKYMINAKFVSDMVGLLYAPDFYKIKPEEVRDALSAGQLKSKLWLRDELLNIAAGEYRDDAINGVVLIVGGWIGALSNLLLQTEMRCFGTVFSSDINPVCEVAARKINENYHTDFKAITADMYHADYSEFGAATFINTSCEHIPDVRGWLNLLPEDSFVCLQSNNMFGVEGHVNCCESLEEFIEKAKLTHIDYSGEIITNESAGHKRFMLIGRT